jgi:CRISPR-associated protein Csb3
VDVTNPGQFFACCGLLELAYRLWPGAEGSFAAGRSVFAIHCEDKSATLETLLRELCACQVLGLSDEERRERDALEAESRRLKNLGQRLPQQQEARRTELGELARKGAIRLGPPFALVLNWWQTDDDPATPKTWAGRQELHKVARAAQDALSHISEPLTLFDHGCILRMPDEYRKGASAENRSVEPFYFDARRFAHALDAGFSLDVQDAETIAHPAVELLALVGLQRFRPAPASEKWTFDYWTWPRPLAPCVAASVTSGVVPIPGCQGYHFHLLFRDDQKRYKAFSFATPQGEDQRWLMT